MKYVNYITMMIGSKPVEINMMFYGWLIVAFFFLILEMGSPGLFFFISFFFGGLVAAGVSCITDSIIMQAVSFSGAVISALFVLRYVVIPMLGKDRHHERTNVYALKGKHGFVVKPISLQIPGFVRINGELWVAQVTRDEHIDAGSTVEVIAVRGAHVVVKKV
jgi:membrane protein implicated in regulation of membrane protease activity